MGSVKLFSEDFSSFLLGDFPFETDLGAMGEYHVRPFQWHGGEWYDPTPIIGSGGTKTWMITEADGKKCLEYSTATRQGLDSLIMLTAGDSDWSDYSVSCRLNLLRTDNCAGIIFRYVNSLCFYLLCFKDGKIELIKRDAQESRVLAATPFSYGPDEWYRLTAACTGRRLVCSVDDKKLFEIDDDTWPAGNIAVGALAPVRFADILVEAEKTVAASLQKKRVQKEKDLVGERSKYPQPRLWKTISLRNFGAGRSIRFGLLKEGAELCLLFAQCQRRVHRDAHARISCLTAVDLDGNILWQRGEPNPQHALITADLPFQIYDINGDGVDEVIMAEDFKLMILDGRTGETKNWVHTPLMDRPDYPFDRLNVDAIRLCDFSGKGRPTDILIKDRYKKLWAYRCDLKLLWTYEAPVNTGHFPFTKDLNGDGREEMFVGYDLVDADGKLIWSLPIQKDHTDEIVIGPIDPEAGSDLIALVSGEEGFMLVNLEGNILAKHIVGHAQRLSVGNYQSFVPGYEICVSTYWGNQGIIYLFDCKGKLLWSFESPLNGNVIAPVNWTGDGRDLILLNGNVQSGGLIDGNGHQVVRFPDDGHPELCAEVIDLTGDCRDEIVLWDEKRMHIYTQDAPAGLQQPLAPIKYPHSNASNYRGEYSFW